MIMRRMQQPEFQYLNIPTCGCPVSKSQNAPLKGKNKEIVVFLFNSIFYSVCLTHHKAWLKPNYYSILRTRMQKREERGKLCLSSCLSEAHPKTYKQDSWIKPRLSVPESTSLDFAYEPINFVVSGKGVSKKFILKKNSKKSHFVLVVMCSSS